MAIILNNRHVCVVRLSARLEEFPQLLAKQLKADPTTGEVEAIGKAYVAADFPLLHTADFIKAVCKWGNYEGVGGKVLKRNALDRIRATLKSAYQKQLDSQPKDAVAEITRLNGLAVSFGSKHLKFMDPDRAVVLDSIISERLGYRRDPDGYAEFLSDCFTVRDMINKAGIPATATRRTWRVADVEMALFGTLR